MADEEKAEDYTKGKGHEHYNFLIVENSGCPADFAKVCYLDGLAEGRKESKEIIAELKAQIPQWHDLRENPNDLPEHSGLYCVQNGEVRDFDKEEKSWFTVHIEPCMNRTEDTYMWCELPQFEGKNRCNRVTDGVKIENIYKRSYN